MTYDINIAAFRHTSIHPRISIEALSYAFLNTEPPQIQDMFNYIGRQEFLAHHYTFSFHRRSLPAARQAAMTKPRIHPTEAQTKYHILFLSLLSPIVKGSKEFFRRPHERRLMIIATRDRLIALFKHPVVNSQLSEIARSRAQHFHG